MIVLLVLLGWVLFIAVALYAGYRRGGRKAFEDRRVYGKLTGVQETEDDD